jgi:predicted enzyme related to lactoylglutathione lyase
MEERFRVPGAFSWAELMTTDVDKAIEFYSTLFGWTVREAPMEGFTYNVIAAGDHEVGGIMPLPPNAQSMPPIWGSYVTVEDVDATAAKAVELGGKILMAPRDIPDVGRFCLIQDPQGAMISAISYCPKA